MRLQVGTTGWSHPDWVGPFYPVHMRERPEQWLAHYATRFRTVELGSTFDRFPDEDLVASWSREGVALRERGPFELSLKLPRVITHEALPGGDVEAAREWTGRFDREVLDPLAGEEILGAVLVQLPPGYRASPDAAADLMETLAPLAERRVALELRDPSWVRDGCVVPELERIFANGEVCLVDADLPGALDVAPPIGARHAYFRFHGRNAAAWADTGVRDGSRYDHLYTREELEPFAQRVQEHLRAGREVRAYFHNAPRAQAVANAVDLAELIGAPPEGARPRLTAQQRLPW